MPVPPYQRVRYNLYEPHSIHHPLTSFPARILTFCSTFAFLLFKLSVPSAICPASCTMLCGARRQVWWDCCGWHQSWNSSKVVYSKLLLDLSLSDRVMGMIWLLGQPGSGLVKRNDTNFDCVNHSLRLIEKVSFSRLISFWSLWDQEI